MGVRKPVGRPVSIAPSDMVPDDEASSPSHARPDSILQSIRYFRPAGDREHYAGYSVPHYVRLALDAAVALLAPWHTNVTHVGVWALARGLERVRWLEDVKTICAAREDLLRRGFNTDYVDHWPYSIAPRGRRSVRLYLRRIDPADIGRVGELHSGLGLEISTVATLAIMAGVLDLPLRGDVPHMVETEIRDWRRALRQRAAIVADLRSRAVATPEPPRHRATWEEMEP